MNAIEIQINRTLDIPAAGVRVKPYRGGIVVWEMAHAGKRGKMVQRIDVEGDFDTCYEVAQIFADATRSFLDRANAAQAAIADMPRARIYVNDVKGIEVAPMGVSDFSVDCANGAVSIDATNREFMIRENDFNETRTISRKVRGVAKFCQWVRANSATVATMTRAQLSSKAIELGAETHTWCGLD